MSKEMMMTTFVHPNGICPVRGACKVKRKGDKGGIEKDNSVTYIFDLRSYINKIYQHVIRISQTAMAVLLHPPTVFYELDNKLLGACFGWYGKYIIWTSTSKYLSDLNYRSKIWDKTQTFIEDIVSYLNKYQESSSLYLPLYKREIARIEELYKKAKKEASEIKLIAYITDEEHDVKEEKYENLRENIIKATSRLGIDIIRMILHPPTTPKKSDLEITAFVTNRTHFDENLCSIEMMYTTDPEDSDVYDELPSLTVRMSLPDENTRCGNMKQFWFSVEPKPFYKLNFQVTGGSVTAHNILILGGRKYQYVWRRDLKAAPIPGITTSSLLIQDYLNNTLFYVVDTAEED